MFQVPFTWDTRSIPKGRAPRRAFLLMFLDHVFHTTATIYTTTRPARPGQTRRRSLHEYRERPAKELCQKQLFFASIFRCPWRGRPCVWSQSRDSVEGTVACGAEVAAQNILLPGLVQKGGEAGECFGGGFNDGNTPVAVQVVGIGMRQATLRTQTSGRSWDWDWRWWR